MSDDFNAMLDRPRRLVPAMGTAYDCLAPYSYSFIRFCTGAILVPHGVQKVFATDISQYVTSIGRHGLPFPYVLAVLTYSTEFAGAIFLAIGLFTRLAAAMICIQMLVITFVFQWSNGYFWTARGFEFPLLWAMLCLAIFFRGGGRLSVDRLLGWEF